MEHIYQLPIDIRILIALSDPQTASLTYIYDPEFRKYAIEPAFVQSFIQFVSIVQFNGKYEHKLNNRRFCYDIIPSISLYGDRRSDSDLILWFLNDNIYRIETPGLIRKKIKYDDETVLKVFYC
jgi:hypothetical protein